MDFDDMTVADLNEQIALRRGYKVVDLNDNPHGAVVKGPNWVLLDPSGHNRNWAFQRALLFVELWAYDLNVAIELFNELPGGRLHAPNLSDHGDAWVFSWDGWVSTRKVEAPSPQQAIAIAWLTYHDQQKDVNQKKDDTPEALDGDDSFVIIFDDTDKLVNEYLRSVGYDPDELVVRMQARLQAMMEKYRQQDPPAENYSESE